MKRFVLFFCAAGWLLPALPAGSQEASQQATQQSSQPATPAAPAPVVGQVSGHVFCQDSGLPARFAGVQLLAEKPSSAPLIDPASLGKNPDFTKVMAQAMAAVMKGSNLSTVTGIDGSFSLEKVPPGTYYVIPQLPGYRSPLSSLSMMERMKADAATVTAVESVAEKIVVQPGGSTSVNIELQRGATLSGTVAYDDGSPAPGVNPALLIQDKEGKWKELSVTMLPATTDDRGQFRFYGLAAGKYAVKATLPVSQPVAGLGASGVSLHMNPGDALVVYQGGALREKDIKPIELVDGDQRDGIEVVFPINGLHTISGSVVAKSDNHAVNAGTITLQDPDSKDSMRTAMVGEDGTFRLSYVPDGSYILKVSGAADMEQKAGEAPAASDIGRMMNSTTVRSYGPAELAVMVKDGDVNGMVVQVPAQ